MTLISIGNAVVEFGASEIFRDVSLTIGENDRWAVVGRNGTGKTTLVRLLTGDLQPTRGKSIGASLNDQSVTALSYSHKEHAA